MEESNMGFNGELEDIFRQQEALHKLEENQYWEQVRIQAAIAAMQGYIAGNSALGMNDDEIAEWSVKQADALIEELKKYK